MLIGKEVVHLKFTSVFSLVVYLEVSTLKFLSELVYTSGVRPRSYTTRIGRIREQEEDTDVTKHRTGRTVRTGAKYRSWVLVKCVWCSAYY